MPACGFADGELLLVFDDTGRYDIFRLDLASGLPLLAPLATDFGTSYGAGATVCRVLVHGYYRDAGSNQLFVVDGDGAAQPIVDRVTALAFQYADAGGTPLDTLLSDGPYRGSAASYDVDLLRIRRVRVSDAIRSGLTGAGSLSIPDSSSTFEIALRNVVDQP